MSDHSRDEMEAPGTFVIAIVFLMTFVMAWLAHLKWVSELWGIQ